MAKLLMQRIEIIALLNDRKKILEHLQLLGVVEFSDVQNEAFVKVNTSSYISQYEKCINTATAAKDILNKYAPIKKSLLASLNGRREIGVGEFLDNVDKRDFVLQNCYDLISYERVINENRAAIVRTQTLMDALKIWLNLDIPMNFKGTKYTQCFIGVVPNQRTVSDILEAIARVNPKLEMIEIDIISSSKEQNCIAVVCHKSVADETNEALRQIGFVVPSESYEQIPAEKMQQYEKDIEKYKNEIEENIKKIKASADLINEVEFLIDYFSIRKEKYQALSKVGLTKNTFIIRGYIPEKYAKKCVDELESKYTVAISITTPEEDEDVPVLLENGDFVSPVEPITEMFALPAKKDIDPSAVMAFFYYLFFGLMLSDAGYGVLMVIGTAIALKKFSIEGPLRKTLKMFFYSGISTVFWGAMFGSWFGDIVPIIYKQFLHAEPPNIALWFEPITDPMKLLLFSFGLGIIHLFVGQAVSFKMTWDEGKKIDAVLDTVPTYLFVLGVAPLAAGILISVPETLSTVGKYLALIGLALIILTSGRKSKNIFARFGGGIYGLYNIASGYLSDILSYSRLLALGLATGSIAGVINLMGTMPTDPAAKAVLLVVVFLIGHPLNMAINLLGAYVHTNRLQFVEFFSKFYEGGGRAFSPLKADTKYIKIKEN